MEYVPSFAFYIPDMLGYVLHSQVEATRGDDVIGLSDVDAKVKSNGRRWLILGRFRYAILPVVLPEEIDVEVAGRMMQ
jgi:hypothetical protein